MLAIFALLSLLTSSSFAQTLCVFGGVRFPKRATDKNFAHLGCATPSQNFLDIQPIEPEKIINTLDLGRKAAFATSEGLRKALSAKQTPYSPGWDQNLEKMATALARLCTSPSKIDLSRSKTIVPGRAWQVDFVWETATDKIDFTSRLINWFKFGNLAFLSSKPDPLILERWSKLKFSHLVAFGCSMATCRRPGKDYTLTDVNYVCALGMSRKWESSRDLLNPYKLRDPSLVTQVREESRSSDDPEIEVIKITPSQRTGSSSVSILRPSLVIALSLLYLTHISSNVL